MTRTSTRYTSTRHSSTDRAAADVAKVGVDDAEVAAAGAVDVDAERLREAATRDHRTRTGSPPAVRCSEAHCTRPGAAANRMPPTSTASHTTPIATAIRTLPASPTRRTRPTSPAHPALLSSA